MLKTLLKSVLFISLLFTAACDFIADDVTDFDFILPEKEFTVDSSQFDLQGSDGTIPEVACPGTPACSELGPEFTCGASGFCEAEIDYNLKSDIILLKDEVEEFAVVTQQDHITVSFKYIQMEVTRNTLNYDLPPMDLYIAPQSVTTLFDANGEINTGVHLVGSLDTIPASRTGYYDVNLSPDGQASLTSFVQQPDVPFYLFVAGTMLFEGGDPVPSGALTVKVHSRATASIN